MIESTNQGWGFYGALNAQAAAAWPLALNALKQTTGFDEAECAVFLDSRSGRHFGDNVTLELDDGKALEAAINAAIATWSSWPVAPRTRRLYGIPSAATYLQAYVAIEGLG